MHARRKNTLRLAKELRSTALRNLGLSETTPSRITGMQPARLQFKPPVRPHGWRIWPPRFDRQGER